MSVPESGFYSSMIQKIHVSANMGREPLYELGRRPPYFRYDSILCESSVKDKYDWNKFNEVLKEAFEKNWPKKGKVEKLCSCPIETLMTSGCKCGGK